MAKPIRMLIDIEVSATLYLCVCHSAYGRDGALEGPIGGDSWLFYPLFF